MSKPNHDLPPSRLRSILGHLLPGGSSSTSTPTPPPPSAKGKDDSGSDGGNSLDARYHTHQLSPTFFLERAAAIEPDAEAIFHITANGRTLRRSYGEFADRARGLAYHLLRRGLRRVGILAPNTPAFLEAIYGIAAAGGVVVPANYRLKPDDIAYIFDYGEVDAVIVDAEFRHLLDAFVAAHPDVPLLVDLVSFSRCVVSLSRAGRY